MKTTGFIIASLCTAVGCLILAPVSCKLGSNADNSTGGDVSTLSSSDLRLTNDISGWSEKAGSYVEYDYDGLYAIIDGGADDYKKYGLIDGILQEMSGTNGRMAKIYVSDQETIENATAMFENEVETSVKQPVSISPYSASAAVANLIPNGDITVFAHFNKFYFSIEFTGYQDQTTSLSDASGFLATYENKLQ